MTVYLQTLNEENLHICTQYLTWGSKTRKIATWEEGDQIIAYVDREVAALFTITSSMFYNEAYLWPSDLYPYRVSLQLDKMIARDARIPLTDPELREMLTEHHRGYGVSIVLAARPLNAEVADTLLARIDDVADWEDYHPELLLEDIEGQRLRAIDAAVEAIVQTQAEQGIPDDDGSPHTEMQFHLASLGRALGFDVWIPKADQHRAYDGMPLATLSIADLPPLPFNLEVLRIIQNIDVIWLRDGHPTHLFEVEHSSAVYSGLLRMSDLITLIPSLNIDLYICSGRERYNKVLAEVNRPTFSRRSQPLASRCRFIEFARLATFMAAQQSYLPYFSAAILDELSESLRR
ncbi:MAG: hypothetical protein GYB68_18400 [Chloroflexi bacterium]|nr:hypothetical protein [Chloroflexota bacterium]